MDEARHSKHSDKNTRLSNEVRRNDDGSYLLSEVAVALRNAHASSFCNQLVSLVVELGADIKTI